MLQGIRKTLAAVGLAALAALVVVFAPDAVAGPSTNYFAAYDYRYETPYSCYGQTCWYVPYSSGNAFTSYYSTTAITTVYIRDAIDGRVNSGGFTIVANQVVGVMCWKASTVTGAIWLLTDSRHYVNGVNGTTALFVGFVPDSDILLSRADRLAYVPECGYSQA